MSDSLTTNYSGTGGHFHNEIEEFIASKRLDVSVISTEDLELENIKDMVIRYLVLHGYM